MPVILSSDEEGKLLVNNSSSTESITTKTVSSPAFDLEGTPYETSPLNTRTASNFAIGTNSLAANNSIGNTAVGIQVLENNTTGSANTGLGFKSMNSNTSGSQNTAVGTYSMYSNVDGSYNVAVGSTSLMSNTTGSGNVAIGESSMLSNTTGSSNVVIGPYALFSNTTGSFNIASGSSALGSNTNGTQNVASGYQALRFNTTGSQNVASGYQALRSNTTGSNNTAYGYQAGKNQNDGSNNTIIGANVNVPDLTGSNQIAIGTGNGTAQATFNGKNWNIASTPPDRADSFGKMGDIAFDIFGYIYYCISTNTWVRTQLTTWESAPPTSFTVSEYNIIGFEGAYAGPITRTIGGRTGLFLEINRTAGGQPWQGVAILDNKRLLSNTVNKIKVSYLSTVVTGSINMMLKLEPPQTGPELTIAQTFQANTWYDLTYDFSTISNFSPPYNKLSIFPNFLTAATQTFYFGDVFFE